MSTGTVCLHRVVLLIVGIATASVAQAQVGIAFDARGLASVTFNGSQFLSSGVLTANRITFQDGAGGTYDANLDPVVTVDAAAGRITNTYSWGTIAVIYRARDNRLEITLGVSNLGSSAIQGVFLEPLALRLPERPAEYDNVTPLMAFDPGEPGVVGLTCRTATVVLGYDDPGKPILAGFPFAYDRPASTIFPVRINTDRDPGYPTLYPVVVRPIAPGGSDQYHFSLRFGAAGSTVESLAADVYSKFSALFPSTLEWADKRPIGQLVLATSAAGYATNPRGWLLDPTIDITTTAGVAAFRNRVLAWADESIAILTRMNAQGMITWDIEGEQFAQPTSYLCDPTVLSRAAPEMDAIADQYFRKFREAGLRVGVCVRPQTLVLDGETPSQQPSADPAQVMIDKITYAKSRWNASLFYVDSNGDPNLPMDPGVFQRVVTAHPDVLIIPEHENTRYYAYTAPYRELRQHHVATPARVRLTYPNAFGVTYVADGDFTQHFDSLKAAVTAGDTLMTRAWYSDPANPEVERIYASLPVSTLPPAVSITAPADGAAVSGTIAVTAGATSTSGIRLVQFRVDGVVYGATLTSPLYSVSLNTTSLANGRRTISATAVDGTGKTSLAEITVVVNNGGVDAHSPTISITPVVSGVLPLLASAFDDIAVVGVVFQVDGVALGRTLTTPPYSASWDTTTAANGVHAIVAVAGDAAGNQSMATFEVMVQNLTSDTQAPDVSLTGPAAGSMVTGTIVLTAEATDNVGVATVQFLVDGAVVGPVLSSSPYSLAWNSASVGDGAHSVTAIARDAAGNQRMAASVQVTARNGTTTACVAVPTDAFLGCYYNALDFAELFATRIDPAVNFNWGNDPPFAGMKTQNYTIRWQGQFTFTGGNYQFSMRLDDGARLYVDDQRVWDLWGEHWAQTYQKTLTIGAGTHVVRLDYVQFSGKAEASLIWSPVVLGR